MTPEDLDLSERIVELLRASRVPVAANEIANHLGATVLSVTIALSKLEGSGDIVVRAAGIRSRRYYELAGRKS